MIKLNADLTQGLDIFKNKISESGLGQTSSQPTTSQTDTVHISQSQQQSFTFFYRSVHNKLEQSLNASTPKLEREVAEQQLAQRDERAEVAANNILKFVELQLKKDTQDGATPKQLQSRIDAALEGFNLGYDEANATLADLELLSLELNQEIALTKEKVLAGIDQLKQDYLGQEPSNEATAPTQTVSEAAYVEKQSAGSANDFSFELTTRDGDKVTINASALIAQSSQSGAYSGSIDGQQVQMAYQSYSSYRESNFAFSVEGELDEDELKAINNLLNQVNDLAGDFYQGDVGKAFNKALELDYNSDEISQFSVSLTQVQNYTAYQAYQTEDTPALNTNTVNQLKPLADFTKELANVASQVGDNFTHPRELITDVMKQITQLRQPMEYPEQKLSFEEFANRLLDQLSSHASTASSNLLN